MVEETVSMKTCAAGALHPPPDLVSADQTAEKNKQKQFGVWYTVLRFYPKRRSKRLFVILLSSKPRQNQSFLEGANGVARPGTVYILSQVP